MNFQMLGLFLAPWHKCNSFFSVSDCGVYAICFAEEVCTLILNNKCDIFNVSFDESHISQTRERLRNTILELSKG